MFCFQCEQTARVDDVIGCHTTRGVCGKDDVTADLQDILNYQLLGIGQYATRLHAAKKPDRKADSFCLYALFTTLTNVNFDRFVFTRLIADAADLRDRLHATAVSEGIDVANLASAARFVPAADLTGLLAQAKVAAIKRDAAIVNDDIVDLRALVLYGLKGVAAYAHHAEVLGEAHDEIYAGIAHALDFLATDPVDAEELLEESLALGRLNYRVMEALDAANTGRFGAPRPTKARMTPVAGKAILISGHDMRDLHALLEATKDLGINVYTHGEMLPAHGYPKLDAYPHLVGNYGSAWQNQQQEFAAFPGPILMTSNCLIEPSPAYRNRIFTAGPVGWAGVRHIEHDDFSHIIKAAQALPGFKTTEPEETVMVGFARDAILQNAQAVVSAVKEGAIKHFFVIGGCDGAAPGRNYYTDFADQSPEDSIIVTLGCGKYRFNRHQYGSIGGIPRLLDAGQCNDAYSAIQVALALSKAFECGVNDLPLTLVISWFEQKAVAVFLTLLALGVRNVRLGPSLPGFLTPNLLNIIVTKFGIQPTTSADDDIAAALNRQMEHA